MPQGADIIDVYSCPDGLWRGGAGVGSSSYFEPDVALICHRYSWLLQRKPGLISVGTCRKAPMLSR